MSNGSPETGRRSVEGVTVLSGETMYRGQLVTTLVSPVRRDVEDTHVAIAFGRSGDISLCVVPVEDFERVFRVVRSV